MELDIHCCVGVGDLISIYSITEQIKDKYSKISICPAYGLLKTYRTGSANSINFVKKLVQIIFSEPPYVIVDKSQSEIINSFYLGNSLGVYGYPIQVPKLCSPEKIDIGIGDSEYIVINTKIREMNRSSFESIKQELFNIINNSNKRTVILGERGLGTNKESLSVSMHLIYSDIINEVNNYIDLTKDVITNDPDINQFRRDLTIIRDASASICFGIGGPVTMSTAAAKRVICLRDDSEKSFVYSGFFDKLGDGNIVTKDKNEFLNNIRNVCL